MELMVLKRDGTKEEFNMDKIRNALINAGATNEEADHVIPDVAAWRETNAENNVIASEAIRLEVIKQLKDVNPTAAVIFEGFKKA